jgi:hypothetical protein
MQWVPGGLSPGVKRGLGLTLKWSSSPSAPVWCVTGQLYLIGNSGHIGTECRLASSYGVLKS